MIDCVYLLIGTFDILMHNPSGMKSGGGDSKFKTKEIPTPEVEAEASRYVTEDGNLWVPSQGIKKSIVAGAVGRRIGKRGAPSVLLGSIFPVDEQSLLIRPDTMQPIRGHEYEVDVRRVVVDKTKGVIRGRARVKLPWGCLAKFSVDEELITPDMVAEIGLVGGRTIGILDYRPQKSGWFGRYSISLIDPKPKSTGFDVEFAD